MRVIVTGATGFIGKALCKVLIKKKYDVIALSRNTAKGCKILENCCTLVDWDGKTASGWTNYADGAYAIINLAGENIGSGIWTQSKKQQILESRLNSAKAIVEAVEQAQTKPKVIIQASAIGYYGARLDEILDESSSHGKGFLSDTVKQWELSAEKLKSLNIRHIVIRTGIVLGRGGGALSRLLIPFRLFAGGPLGNGQQWFSWIHIDDEINAICFLMETENLDGIFNLTSPNPIRMKYFCKSLGKVIKRPSWLPAPDFILKLALGEMAEEMLLSGQRVIPKRLLEAGYKFLYPDAESALLEILT